MDYRIHRNGPTIRTETKRVLKKTHKGWFNEEKQYYSSARLENSFIKDGILHIVARKETLSVPDSGNQNYTSARLITLGKGDWTHGFLEVPSYSYRYVRNYHQAKDSGRVSGYSEMVLGP